MSVVIQKIPIIYLYYAVSECLKSEWEFHTVVSKTEGETIFFNTPNGFKEEKLSSKKITPVELMKLENLKYRNHSNTCAMKSIYPRKKINPPKTTRVVHTKRR